MLTKEKVFSIRENKNRMAMRQSDQILLLKKDSGFPDAGGVMLEDKTGHRYVRDIDFETVTNSDCFIFEMI